MRASCRSDAKGTGRDPPSGVPADAHDTRRSEWSACAPRRSAKMGPRVPPAVLHASTEQSSTLLKRCSAVVPGARRIIQIRKTAFWTWCTSCQKERFNSWSKFKQSSTVGNISRECLGRMYDQPTLVYLLPNNLFLRIWTILNRKEVVVLGKTELNLQQRATVHRQSGAGAMKRSSEWWWHSSNRLNRMFTHGLIYVNRRK